MLQQTAQASDAARGCTAKHSHQAVYAVAEGLDSARAEAAAHLHGARIVSGRDGHTDSVALESQHALADDVARVARARGDHHITCGHSTASPPQLSARPHGLDCKHHNLVVCAQLMGKS